VRWAFVVAAVAGAFAACSTYGSDDDTGPPSGIDAGLDAELEAGVDASTEAGGDGGDGGCRATFCDDFEKGPIGETWDGVQNSGGKLEAVSNSTKGGRAMKATIDAVDAGAIDRNAYLTKKLPVGKRVVCTFLFKPDVIECTSPAFSDVFILRSAGVADGVSAYGMFLAIGPADTGGLREDVFFDDGGCGCPRRSVSLPSWANGVWSAMRIETDFQTVSVSRNDVIIYKGDFAQFTPDSSLTLSIGLKTSYPLHIEATYDDFVCDVTN